MKCKFAWRQIGAGILLGFFCLAGRPSPAGEIDLVAVYKRQVFVQTNAGPPAPRCAPYVFDAIIRLANSNSISAAAIAAPGGTQTTMPVSHSREFLPHAWFSWACENYQSQEALDAAWPAGQYTFFVAGTTVPTTSAELSLAGNAYPTNAPHIQDFEATQNVDPHQDFVLRWDAWSEGSTNDQVFVTIRKVSDQAAVYSTPFLHGEGSLNGTATWIMVPGGTLIPGTDYDVYVRFDKVSERKSDLLGAVGQASYATGTHFQLKTSPPPPGS